MVIEEIKPIKLEELLICSPYGGLYKNLVNVDVFNKELLIETSVFKRLLGQILDDLQDAKTIFFFTGFPGTGKTTFLQWLKYVVNNPSSEIALRLKENEEIKKHLEKREDTLVSILNFSFTEWGQMSPVKNLFVEIATKNFDQYKDTIRVINKYKDIHNELFEFSVMDKFDELASISTTNIGYKARVYKLLTELNIPDHLIILLLLIHKSRMAFSIGKKYSLCLIDNIDAISPKSLYESFWKSFEIGYTKFNQLGAKFSQDLLDVSHLKIIFSLRNYNFARIRPGHNPDRIYSKQSNPYILIFEDEETLKQILEKRLYFFNSRTHIETPKDINLRNIILAMIGEDYNFREKVYMPLFNYDVRHFNQEISIMVERKKEFKFHKNTYDFLYDQPLTKSGARGIILNNLIKTLFLSERKYPIDQLMKEEGESERTQLLNAKYCSISRLLLTVMYNLTYGEKPLNKALDYISDPNLRKFFSYADLISELRTTTYNRNSILDSINMTYEELINRLEIFHGINNESLIHFLNAKGIEIEIEDDGDVKFKDRLRLMEAKQMYTKYVRQNDTFRKIQMQVNPCAIVHLRHLVCHFEYFAAHCYWRDERTFEKEFSPLYLATEKISGTDKFEFEQLLDDVYNLVELKKRVNDNLIRDLIKKENKWGSTNNISLLLRSKLVFRQGYDTGSGYRSSLYSTRIISTHLTYIEQFRFFLNNSNFSKKYSTEIERVNRHILETLAKYISLFVNTNENIKDVGQIREIFNSVREEIIKRLNGKEALMKYIDIKEDS